MYAVKAKRASFDRPGLLRLIQDLYAAHKDTQTFLHTLEGNPQPLALAGRIPATRYLCRKSQTGDLQLQESRWRTGRTGGTDGVLLRMRRRILQ